MAENDVVHSSLDKQYPPNNQASKQQEALPPPPGGAVVPKPPESKNPIKRIERIMFDGDIREAGKYVVKYKLRPALMNAMYEVLSSWLKRTLWGGSAEPPPSSHYPDQPSWQQREDFNGYSRRSKTKEIRRFSNALLGYSSKERADSLANYILRETRQGKFLSVADLLNEIGYGSEWTDNSYGWEYEDVRDISVRLCSDNKWYVIMPDPKRANN